MDCTLCCEKYNLTVRIEIDCPKCELHACRKCIKRYLLESNDNAHCCQCEFQWDRRFLVKNLTASFVNGPYKKHRQDILLQRQRALLPSTVRFIEMEMEVPRKMKEYDDVYANVEKECFKHEGAIRILQNQINECHKRSRHAEGLITSATNEIVNEKNKFARKSYLDFSGRSNENEVQDRTNDFNNNNGGSSSSSGPKKELHKDKEEEQFASRGVCPRESCTGLIMKGWICTKCGLKKCKRCFEPEDKVHTCNEELVESVKTMKTESRPCPSCRTRIQRSEGCPQMFCTECYTFFCYMTGKKIDPRIAHNPEHHRLVREGKILAGKNDGSRISYMARDVQATISWAREYHDYAERHFRKNIEKYSTALLELRIDCLKGRVEEAAWKKKAQEIEKKSHYHRESYELTLTYANTVAMLCNQPCFYDSESRAHSNTSIQLLKINFEEQKDELCKWYSYRPRQLEARKKMGDRWRGYMASYS